MQFDQKDIEAVAASRVSRAESKKTNQWMIVAMVGVLAGTLVMTQVNKVGGLVVIALGFVVFLYWQNQLSTKQKRAKAQLVQQWYSEQQVPQQ